MEFAFRQLFKNPGFTVIALLTLALGIGVNTTTFTLVNSILYRLPPFADPNHLVQIFGTSPQDQFSSQAPADVLDLVQQQSAFQQVAPYCFNSVNLARAGDAREPRVRSQRRRQFLRRPGCPHPCWAGRSPPRMTVQATTTSSSSARSSGGKTSAETARQSGAPLQGRR